MKTSLISAVVVALLIVLLVVVLVSEMGGHRTSARVSSEVEELSFRAPASRLAPERSEAPPSDEPGRRTALEADRMNVASERATPYSVHDGILVRVRTPDGAPLARAMMSSPAFAYRCRLEAVATAEPIPVEEGRSASYQPIGTYVGIGRGSNDWNVSAAPADALGRLRAPSLPVHVSLVLGGRVVASQLATSPEVIFILPLDRVKSPNTCCVSVIVRDEITGAPLENARVDILREQRFVPADRDRDATNAFSACFLPEGDVHVRVEHEGCTSRELDIPAESGSSRPTIVELRPTTRLHGRVLDHDGRPVACGIELVPIPRHPKLETVRRLSDANGFTIPSIVPAHYVVRSITLQFDDELANLDPPPRDDIRTTSTGCVPPQDLDLTQGPIDELVLHLEPAGRVTIHVAPELVHETISVTTPAGLPLYEKQLVGRHSLHLLLPEGKQRVRWTTPDGGTLERDFVVGDSPTTLHLP